MSSYACDLLFFKNQKTGEDAVSVGLAIDVGDQGFQFVMDPDSADELADMLKEGAVKCREARMMIDIGAPPVHDGTVMA